MRIALDTSFARRGPSGTATYVERLVEALRAHTGIEVIELSRGPRPPGRREGRRDIARSAGNLAAEAWWTHRALPRAVHSADAELIHHPLPAWSAGAGMPQVVTVHDAAFERMPDRFDSAWVRLARRRHRAAVRRAAVVIAVSEHARRDAVELLGAPSQRVIVAPHGPGQALPPVERAPEPRHFLYVGDDEPRKDLPGLLAAYAEYRRTAAGTPIGLVLAGAAARRAAGAGVTGEPEPDARRLAELHARAAALVHPSLDEGFGLTLAEAMTAGTPVVAVRNRGVEDVFGDAALLVEPEGVAEALARLAADEDLRGRLAAAGADAVAGLSWEASARAHEVAYTLALEGSPK